MKANEQYIDLLNQMINRHNTYLQMISLQAGAEMKGAMNDIKIGLNLLESQYLSMQSEKGKTQDKQISSATGTKSSKAKDIPPLTGRIL